VAVKAENLTICRAVGRNRFIAPLRGEPPRLDWPS
jgi:hypothetical protein